MRQINYYTGSKKPELMYQRAYGTGSLVIESEYYNTTKMSPSELIKEFFGYPIQTAYSLAGDLINWKLYGNSVQRIEGFDYDNFVPLESLYNNSTSVIIPTKPTQSTKVTCYFKSTNVSSTQALLGARDSSSGSSRNSFTIWENVSGHMRFDYQSGQVGDGNISTTDWNYVVKDGKNNYLNGEALTANNEETFSCSYDIAIGGVNTAGSTSSSTNSEYGVVEIYADGVNISFIGNPAKRKSDNAVGFYDVINKQFYTNSSFTAGAVAPTPNSPVDIKSVGDRTKNLFDKSKPTSTYYTETNTGFTISVLSGNSSSSVTPNFSTICPNLEVGKTYMFIYDTEETAHITLGAYSTGNYKNSGVPFVLTEELYTGQMRAGGGSAGTARNIDFSNFMLVEGSVAPTQYVPYGYQIPVTVGSQGFVDLGSLNWAKHSTQSGIWSVSLSGKEVGITNIFTTAYEISTETSIADQPNKTIKGHRTSTLVYIRDDDKYNNMTATEFKQSLSGVYLYYQRTTDTTWTPPTTTPVYLSNQLRKVGNFADVLYYENQQVVRNVGVKVLNGTESWSYASVAQAYYVDGIVQALNKTHTCYCSHFMGIPTDQTASTGSNKIKVGSNTTTALWNRIYAYASITTYPTVEDFKQFLAQQYANGTPVTILYPLATPVTEPLTVPALTMAEGTNIITAETEIKPSDMFCRGYVSQL